MAFGLVNYLNELPFFAAEVLPRMERLGLRERTERVIVAQSQHAEAG
jgi:hypothetical protein